MPCHLFKLRGYVFSLIAVLTVSLQAETFVSPLDERIAVMGRTVNTDDSILMAYPAITLRFNYAGAAPTILLSASNENCYFNLSCNGWQPVRIHLKQGDNEIVLPTGRAPDRGWEIELVRRTEAWMGTATFNGIKLPDDGQLLAAPELPERKILLLGDSATCGEFIERFPPENNDNAPEVINAGRSFGILLGKALDAQVHIVSYGGRGVMFDWAGRADTNNAPQYFPLAHPDDPTALWDHDSYQPDVVLIHLGITDFLTDPVEDDTYVAAYLDLLKDIRTAHPSAALVLAESVGLSNEPGTPRKLLRDQLRGCLDRVVATLNNAGDAKAMVAPLGYYPGTPTDPHPVAFQHEQIAEELLPSLRQATGW